MDGTNKDLIKKAKRRIKRAIKTGEKVTRVSKVADDLYEYTYKHGSGYLLFKSGKLGRLRLL